MNRMIWITIFILVAGCTNFFYQTPVMAPPPLSPSSFPSDYGWRAIRFRMDRPDGKTHWERDLFIAHRIVAPVLRDLEGEIDLWRFHRRASDDKAGHQFSFIFFSSVDVARQVNDRVAKDPIVQRILSDGWVRELITATVDRNDQPAIGDTSDPNWPVVMQDNWPYFIMGVSRMWLGMIDQVSREMSMDQELTDDGLMDHYAQVNEEITHIWQKDGAHALLHHLNAIYGYEALMYWERKWKTF